MDDLSKIKETLTNVNSACKYLLQNNASATVSNYLNERIPKHIQNIFDFGFYPAPEQLALLTSFINKDELFQAKLLFSKQIEDSLFPRTIEFSYFENYPLILPFKDQYGRIQGLVARSLLDDKTRKDLGISKYKNTNSFHKSKYLFGLYENKEYILKAGFVYLVEGQFDVIKAYEHNIRNIVAVGSCSLSNTQLALIKRYTNRIFLLFDNDKAGTVGRQKILNKYSKYMEIKNAYVPLKYKDIDEYLSNLNGKEIQIDIPL